MDTPIYLYSGPEFGERSDAVFAVKEAMRKAHGELDEYLFLRMKRPFRKY